MAFSIPQYLQQRMREKLKFLYGANEGEIAFQKLIDILISFAEENPEIIKRADKKKGLTEGDIVLITYGDQVKKEGERPLKTLKDFLDKYFKDSISTVHILPFFPYSSDDGFAVIDYTRVNPELGDWSDISGLNEDFQLMFDAVINHISSKSEWFKKYKQGDKEYQDYFIEVDPEIDLSMVTRPRTKPLLTPVETDRGQKHVWTTFSPDQIDLNYENKNVLLKIIEILLFYVKQGARIIRLDAIAYLWKKLKTSCIHLEETHKVIQLFKDVFEAVASEVLILTETNVPHEENISYFGDGYNEAQMVYQFTLPPLVLHSFSTGNAKKLSEWAATLKPVSEETTFFNFLASHDGIGVRPAEGILTQTEINNLAERAKKHGGDVSYKANGDGTKSPYELNITYFDAIVNEEEPVEVQVDKFIASQSILLSMKGVPGIYIHSLLGSRNYNEGIKITGEKRTINREKLLKDELEKELTDHSTIRYQVYHKYTELIKIRKKEKAFHPNAAQRVLFLNDSVFSLLRTSVDKKEKIIALHNVSGEEQIVDIDLTKCGIDNYKNIIDLISGETIDSNLVSLRLKLRPYQVMWVKIDII